jgi:hypothetical protein
MDHIGRVKAESSSDDGPPDARQAHRLDRREQLRSAGGQDGIPIRIRSGSNGHASHDGLASLLREFPANDLNPTNHACASFESGKRG